MGGKEKKRWVGNGEISLLEKNDIGTSIPFCGRMGTGGGEKEIQSMGSKNPKQPFYIRLAHMCSLSCFVHKDSGFISVVPMSRKKSYPFSQTFIS